MPAGGSARCLRVCESKGWLALTHALTHGWVSVVQFIAQGGIGVCQWLLEQQQQRFVVACATVHACYLGIRCPLFVVLGLLDYLYKSASV
jgi:hypothetical protein